MSSYDYPHETPGTQQATQPDQDLAAAALSASWPGATTRTLRRFSVGDALVFGGGAFVLLFSFLPFVSYSESIRGPIDRSGYDTWFNAWETQTFMAPLTWFAVLAAAAAAAASVGSYIFAGKLRLLTFSTAQLQLLFSLFAAFVLFGYAMSSKSVIFGSDYAEYLGDKTFAKGIEFSAGGYLMLIFALLAVIGAFMNLYRVGPTLFPRSRPSATDVSA